MKLKLPQTFLVVFCLVPFAVFVQAKPPEGAGNPADLIAELRAEVETSLAELRAKIEASETTRANAGLYMMTTWETAIAGSCSDGGSPAVLTRIGKGWAVMVPSEDNTDRMNLILNSRNSSGSLITLTDTHEMSLDMNQLGGTVNNQLDLPQPVTVFIDGGEISNNPDGGWSPAGSSFTHYNNQLLWGGMSDDGSSFTIVTSFVEGDGGSCDLGVSITMTGVRQRTL